ncbi:MAG: bifunctional metallophosphatase/5'-nucleotidase [bacterium]|nr:MAG: bifunctional metallophosphatase/5'-nucleotidase [bacterium]
MSIFKKQTVLLLLLNFLILPFYFCTDKDGTTSPPGEINRQIIILYTNDEHGWMEANETTGGAAGLMGLWRETEGYKENGPYLILSGGDMWTGPAISTWFKGQSMAEVMNAMDYSAAAIGNHEFDFKIDVLKERMTQSAFPYLSANIKNKHSGTIAEFATPYIIKEVNEVKVGIIGLASTSTPWTTFPDHVADYNFIACDTALRETIPQVRADGAELLIVVGHIGKSEMQSLVPIAREYGIIVIGGGHIHEKVASIVDDIAIIESGANMVAYAKVDLIFDIEADTLVQMKAAIHENVGGTPDPEIEAIVEKWRALMDQELSQVIGYVSQEIGQRTNAMFNMVTDSWLYTYPTADISLTNIGGIRQSILAGNITMGTIVGVLPFENMIVQLELTGTQLIDCIGNLIVGGMTTIGGYQLSDGTPIHPDSMYNVLTTDYLYARSDYNFHLYDADPYNTSIHYRQPVIDWIKSLNTSAGDPLDQYLDPDPRRLF